MMSYATEQSVLNGQWNAAEMAFQAERARCAPHVLMRPAIFPDGDMWCALLGEDLQVGICGFGETPAKACAAFDKAWNEGITPAASYRKNSASASSGEWQPLNKLPTAKDNTYLVCVEDTEGKFSPYVDKAWICPSEKTGWLDINMQPIERGTLKVTKWKPWPEAPKP